VGAGLWVCGRDRAGGRGWSSGGVGGASPGPDGRTVIADALRASAAPCRVSPPWSWLRR